MSAPDTYCGYCGEPARVEPVEGTHVSCGARLELEPPRYCAQCRRRMRVQVTPRGWTADCVEHGSLLG